MSKVLVSLSVLIAVFHGANCFKKCEVTPVTFNCSSTSDGQCTEWIFEAKDIRRLRLAQTSQSGPCEKYTNVQSLDMMVSANITRCNGTFDGLITTKSDNTTHRISFSPEEGIHCHQVVSGEDEDYDFEEDAKPRNTRVQARAMMDMPGSDGQVSKFRFLEYVVVADHKLYVDYFNSDAQLIKEYVALRVEGLNRIFDPLEIQIVLKHVEVFNVTDEIGDAPNLEEKLGQFKTYAKNKLHPMYKFDAAHLITGTQYAKMPSISSDSKACLPVSVSAIRFNDMDDSSGPSETHIMTRIMARELGSNLDLPLLNASRQCPCEHSQGCVMVDKTPGLFWTNCSKSKLTELTLDGDLDCLSSSPMDAMMVCGDGKVDKGEECDCLPSDLDCQKCCNLATCKLFANATCSSGSCCEGCSLIANGGKVCHQNASECALPVSCDGTSATCPIDLPFLHSKLDGKACSEGGHDGFCFAGRCRSRSLQCMQIFGQEAKDCHAFAYQQNEKGTELSNCGQEEDGSVRKCRKADIFCGKLHCQLVEDEKFDHSIFHQSFVNEGNNCYVMNSTKLRTGYYQDMVDHMTKCGEGKYCKNQRCVVNDWKALQLSGGANSQVAAPVWPLTVAALVIVLVFCAFAAVVYNYRRSQSRDVEPVSYQNGQ